MIKNKRAISDFYDKYIDNQIKYSYNERHYFVLEETENLGLKSDSSMLEIGCGIGVITKLLAEKITTGSITSVDISPKSIEYAKNNISAKNIDFIAADVVEHDFNKKYDFISLFDVLEHIPVDKFPDLFSKIETLMSKDSFLVINIPTCEHIKYIEKNAPEKLQIIDQPIPVSHIIDVATKAGLRLHTCKFSNIWEKYDYQFLVFILPFTYTPEPIVQKKKKSIFSLKK